MPAKHFKPRVNTFEDLLTALKRPAREVDATEARLRARLDEVCPGDGRSPGVGVVDHLLRQLDGGFKLAVGQHARGPSVYLKLRGPGWPCFSSTDFREGAGTGKIVALEQHHSAYPGHCSRHRRLRFRLITVQHTGAELSVLVD